MKFTKSLTLLITVLTVLVLAAYGQKVHFNYDQGTNFASYKTYQWVDIPGGAISDQLVDQAIRRAIDQQLVGKGLTKVESNADLFVGYQALVKEEKSLSLVGSGIPRGPFGGWGGGWDSATVQGQTSTISVGTLIVNVIDPARNQLIWRGDASSTLNISKNPDKNYKSLQKVMAKLFQNYPPRAK